MELMGASAGASCVCRLQFLPRSESRVGLKKETAASCRRALDKGLVHTVSSQDFRSFHFQSFFLPKIVQLNFFCEITTFTSRLLSFDKFFPALLIFYDFKPNFLLEAGKILRGLNGFKFSR